MQYAYAEPNLFYQMVNDVELKSDDVAHRRGLCEVLLRIGVCPLTATLSVSVFPQTHACCGLSNPLFVCLFECSL